MKLKITLISILIFLMSITISDADKVTLKNGNIIEGNVVEIYDEENPAILFDVVIDGELVGAKIKLYGTEVAIIEVDNTYRHLKRKELTPEEREKDMKVYQERQKGNSDIDDRIIARIKRNAKRREREEDKIYKKSVIRLKHDNRKDLITHSKKEFVTPIVKIEDRDTSQNNHHYHEENNYRDYE